jgi:flagellar hook-length control protein FliK
LPLPPKTPSQTATETTAVNQLPPAPAGGSNAGAAKAAQPPTSAEVSLLPGVGRRSSSQTESSSASSDSGHRRRTENGSAQPATTPNANSQMAAVAMVIAPQPTAGAPSAAKSDSQSPADPTQAALLRINADLTKGTSAISSADSNHDQQQDAVAPMKVDVVSQATHFAPVAWLSPAQQIVDAMSSTLASAASGSQETGSGSAAAIAGPSASLSTLLSAARPSSSPVKTLDLQLEPQNLGSVSVKLNLSDAGLTVEVQASQAATADLLDKDKRTLTDGLHDAGYTISGVQISFAPSNGAATGFTDQGAAQNPSGQNSGGAQGNGGSQTQDGGAHDSFSRPNHRQDSQSATETTRSAARGSSDLGLYI